MKKMITVFVLVFAQLMTLQAQTTNPAPYSSAGYDDEGGANPHYISKVTLGTLSNNSGTIQFPAPHYVFYNNLTAPNLQQDSTYTITIDHDGNAHFIAVYIDFNKNEVFAEENELIGFQTVYPEKGTDNTTNPSVFSFKIPSTALTGVTRMRILVFEDDNYTWIKGNHKPTSFTFDGKGSLDWGETEDYNVNITSKTGTTIQKGDFQITYNETGSGVLRTFYMSVPNDYDSNKSYPLLFAWHGSGMPGSDMRTFIKTVNTNINAIICCPDINGMTTNSQIVEMITQCMSFYSKYKIDPSKRVITGFSMGGGLSFQIGLQNTSSFNGVIGISPAISSAQFSSGMWNNLKNIKMATILGTADFNWNAVNSLMLDIQNKGGSLLYLVKQGVTHADNVYLNSQEFKNDYKHYYNYVVGITSIEKFNDFENISISVYPNPFQDEVNVKVVSKEFEKIEIKVFDLFGKEIYSTYSKDNTNFINKSISLENLIEGVYIISVRVGDQVYYRKINKMK